MKKNLLIYIAAVLLLTGCANVRRSAEHFYPLPETDSIQETAALPEADAEERPDESGQPDELSSFADNIVTPSMSEYEKVKAIHDYLVIHVDYDYENLQNDTLPDEAFTAEGALLYHSAVCQGYAEAFSLLCSQAGLTSTLICGTAKNESVDEPHAWNQVRVDGMWYNIDVTWDDPLLNGQIVTDGSNMIYDYFLIPDSEIEKDHVPDASEDLHECTSTIYMEGNRERTIAPYLTEPYTFVSSSKEILKAAAGYLSEEILQFQIVYDTEPELALEKSDQIMQQVKDAMETCRIYGQIEMDIQYGTADYLIVNITVTPQ